MRILVMFDLPVVESEDRKLATQFRAYLLKDGFDMLQYSVYSRICAGYDSVDKHVNRLKLAAPRKGAIRVMTVTNKQYSDMHIMAGTRKPAEKMLTEERLSLF